MKILILGAGKMGLFLADLLSVQHEVAVFDSNREKLRFTYNTLRLASLDEVRNFEPDLLINAVTLKYTIEAFNLVIPHLPAKCLISDIASVKTELPEYYASLKRPFVSSHPMFGPTFANLSNLTNQNVILIKESDAFGLSFFKEIYRSLGVKIFEYTFEEHDETIAYSLSTPFASTLTFASVMKPQEAPGTTFQKHHAIAKGLLSEDDYLLIEILFNPYTIPQLQSIRAELQNIISMIENRDTPGLQQLLKSVRDKVK